MSRASDTGDETADYLLRMVAIIKRVGSPRQKADAPKWDAIIRTHAEPVAEPDAVSFATAAEPQGEQPNP